MQPEILENRLEKYQNRDHESYEYVFYTNKCREHLKGTNQYQFEFPGTWRTKTGGECVIGIRSLELAKVSRRLNFQTDCYNYLLKTLIMVYSFLMGPTMTCSDILTYLEGHWFEAAYPWERTSASVLQWTFEPTAKQFIFQEGPFAPKMMANCTVVMGHQIQNESFSIDAFRPTFPIGVKPVTPIPDPIPEDLKNNMRAVVTMPWNRQDLLLSADFINQADNQHLGFTGTQYYPLKEYNIKRNTPYFMISLFEENNLRPIELPADGKDYVVIEALISRSLI
jgi:hypothetical protein